MVTGTDYVDTWSDTENVKWRTTVPGIGHSSPIVWKDHLFLTTSRDGGTKVSMLAYSRRDGKLLWETPVPIKGNVEHIYAKNSHASATATTDGERIYASFGTHRGNTFEVIPTPVVGHGYVFCSSGRAGPTFAIRPGGSSDVTTSHVAWTSPRGSPFVPSSLIHGDLPYQINDMQSILTVFHAKPGELAYQERLGVAMREGFSASPVSVGDLIYFTNDDGQTFVIEAGPTFKLRHVNDLKARVIASPALVDGIWYWRTDRELLAIGNR